MVRTVCLNYERIGAAGFVLPSQVSYYAHTYSVVKVLSPSYLIQFPPLTFRHTMPALAYVSGKCSLPSAADARGQFGRRGNRFGFLGALAAWLAPRSSSDPNVPHAGTIRQAPNPEVSKRTQSKVCSVANGKRTGARASTTQRLSSSGFTD